MRRDLCLAPLLLLAGCSSAPDVYAPPIDRNPLNGFGTTPIGAFVNMNDANADAYMVRDIGKNLQGGLWRWTGKRPELRFFLDSAGPWRFKVDFAIADATFPRTGPVTISVIVNKQLLEKVTYDRPGAEVFLKPVPSAMIVPQAFNDVAIELDKVWVSSADGAELGIILTRAGFVH